MVRAFLQRLGGTNQSIGRFLITCMVIGFISLVLVGIAAVVVTGRNQEHTRLVNHTYEVEIAIDRAATWIEQGETTRRGYLLTGQKLYLESYRAADKEIPVALHRVSALTVDNPRQRITGARFVQLTNDLRRARERTVALVSAGQREEAGRQFAQEAQTRPMRVIRSIAEVMRVEERRLLAIRDEEQRGSVQTFYTTLVIAAILLIVVAGFSLATVLRYTRDLGASRDSLRDFADSLEEQVRERTADLIRANEEIQRFAYIVSHDLRAPLVNVMGFTAELDGARAALAELVDRAEAQLPEIVTEEARFAIREDLPEAISFIRTSTEKMDRLINAILKLAREGRRVLAPEHLAMRAMIETIRETLQHRLDAHGTELVIEHLPDTVSDRLAMEQIFSNLIENAVKYLQPGRPGRIVVRGSQRLGRLIYEVEDNGRGIAEADHSRVFDLFRRSGNQDQPGEGIGLAHVRALAYRLGGVIDVHSTLGEGALFRVSLPTSFNDLQDTAP